MNIILLYCDSTEFKLSSGPKSAGPAGHPTEFKRSCVMSWRAGIVSTIEPRNISLSRAPQRWRCYNCYTYHNCFSCCCCHNF